MGAHVQLLMDNGNAQLLRLARGEVAHLLSKDFHAARIPRINAAEDFHQGGFARAVLAQQGHDLPRPQVKGYVVQGFHARECLVDVGQLYDRLLHSHFTGLSFYGLSIASAGKFR